MKAAVIAADAEAAAELDAIDALIDDVRFAEADIQASVTNLGGVNADSSDIAQYSGTYSAFSVSDSDGASNPSGAGGGVKRGPWNDTAQKEYDDLVARGYKVYPKGSNDDYLKSKNSAGRVEVGNDAQSTEVSIGANASNAVMREEYLHVARAEARNYRQFDTLEESYMEEADVETMVINDAQALGMTPEEIDNLEYWRDYYYVRAKAAGYTKDSKGYWVVADEEPTRYYNPKTGGIQSTPPDTDPVVIKPKAKK